MKNKQLIVITGIDSGIGKSLCEQLSAKGFFVAATYLETNPFPENPNVLAAKMDIRNEDEIASFAGFISHLCKTNYNLYAVINNAGIALGGPVEDLPLKIYREVFEINFFGLVSFTQKMIPLLINSKGRIFIVGSMAGRIAMPFLSPYVSSKYALEGFCDSLRREISQFSLSVTLFEPGGIATPIWTKAKSQDISFVSSKYQNNLKLFEKNFIDSGVTGFPASLAAKRMTTIILKKSPKYRYIIDRMPFISYITLIIPALFIDKFTAKLFGMRWDE